MSERILRNKTKDRPKSKCGRGIKLSVTMIGEISNQRRLLFGPCNFKFGQNKNSFKNAHNKFSSEVFVQSDENYQKQQIIELYIDLNATD